MNLSNYKTIIFDCDGVILNSNAIKSEAFYQTALPYGKEAAEKLVQYNIIHGGISRYKKFEWFINDVLQGNSHANETELLESYAKKVKLGLMRCEVTPNLNELRQKTLHTKWIIASGGDEIELRTIFQQRGLDHLFDGGIFGSPTPKLQIVLRELQQGNIQQPALFIGDSKYDFEVASQCDIDFVFVSDWSEFKDYSKFFIDKDVKIFKAIQELSHDSTI